MFLRKVYCGLTMALMFIVAAAMPVFGDNSGKMSTEKRAAVVNGAAIMKDEVDGEVLLLQRSILAAGKPLDCEQIAAIQKEVIESMIRREILYQESRKAGVRADRDTVNKELDAVKKQFPSDADYVNELKRKNLNEETLRERLEKNLAVQQYVDKQFTSAVTVTDSDIISYYQGNMGLFTQPLQVRASHILIKTEPGWDESRKKDARRKADEILKDLKKGKDFASIAKEQSDGPTKMNGGDLGYLRTGQLEKQLETVVFDLKSGEMSDVVETDYGFHLFKVTDKKPATVLPFENVKEKIREFLRDEKAKQEAYLHAKKLREKAAVEIFN